MFEFGVGVLRWTWRVMYYGYVVLGTDQYPPFTLHKVPDYRGSDRRGRYPAQYLAAGRHSKQPSLRKPGRCSV